MTLPPAAWKTIAWREGTNAALASRFAAVRPAHRDYWRATPYPEEWLLIEWPKGEPEPIKYWLSTMPEKTRHVTLVDHAKLRWRIERDYQELKQEVGLGHYEGRGWRGFHHHAMLCIAAHGFLISERSLIPPQPLEAKQSSKRLRCPEVIDLAEPPLRPERHVTSSIATLRIKLARSLARSLARNLARCPCCQRKIPRNL